MKCSVGAQSISVYIIYPPIGPRYMAQVPCNTHATCALSRLHCHDDEILMHLESFHSSVHKDRISNFILIKKPHECFLHFFNIVNKCNVNGDVLIHEFIQIYP